MPERPTFALRTYRRFTRAAMPFVPLLISTRLRRGKEAADRVAERRGETDLPRPRGPLVWIHGASVGEMLAIVPLVEQIHARGLNVLVTSGTVTSARLAEYRLPPGTIHQFVPFDAPRFVTRFLDYWRPNLALFAESDLWPNLIAASSARNIPLILVNGRVSERSFLRWQRMPGTIKALLSHFDLCLAQSLADAERYSLLGAPRIATTGNLKLDVPAPPADPNALAMLENVVAGRPMIAAASTHPGEEKVIIDAHRRLRQSFPGLLTVIAPRHPERGPGIAEIAYVAGLHSASRSQAELPAEHTDIYVADTIGELGLFYRLAPIVFMGGSLVRHGGQNPIEAAKLGSAIVHGPHVWNFAEIYGELDRASGATEVEDGGKLALRLGAWLKDSVSREAVADAARRTVEELGGARNRTLAALEPYLMQLRLEHR